MDRKSFERVEKFWVPEIQKINSKNIIKKLENLSFIVVGNKVDLRNDSKYCEQLKVKPVTEDENN